MDKPLYLKVIDTILLLVMVGLVAWFVLDVRVKNIRCIEDLNEYYQSIKPSSNNTNVVMNDYNIIMNNLNYSMSVDLSKT